METSKISVDRGYILTKLFKVIKPQHSIKHWILIDEISLIPRQFERIIDVGGSKGSKALCVLKHHPHLRALVIDQPQVIREARHYWEGKQDQSLLARVTFQPGDVLESLPPAANDKDIYFLSAVLHGFDDDTCVRVLNNIAVAISTTAARIALLEIVMDETRPDLASSSFDMQMFMATRGRERTLREWETVFSRSAVQLEEVVNLRTFGKILVLQTQPR